MRILQLMKWLSPKEDVGGKIRSYGLGRALASFATVDAAGYLPVGERIRGNEEHLAHYKQLYPLEVGSGASMYMDSFVAFNKGLSLRSARFVCGKIRPFLKSILQRGNYNILQVEELPMMSAIDFVSRDIPVVYSAHNAESQLSADIFRRRNPILSLLANMEQKRTATEEKNALLRAKACIAVSDQDRNFLKNLSPVKSAQVHVLPNCAQERFRPSLKQMQSKDILCMGAFGWHPNRQGLFWFMEAVLPLLKKTIPGALIRVVGSGIDTPLRIKMEQHGLFVYPDVPDVLPFLQEARLLTVPLKVGGGSRIKIIEAWAAGLPVVSTSTGANGLSCKSGMDLLIADDPAGFAACIYKLIMDNGLWETIRIQGIDRARCLRWSSLTPLLKELYQKILMDEAKDESS